MVLRHYVIGRREGQESGRWRAGSAQHCVNDDAGVDTGQWWMVASSGVVIRAARKVPRVVAAQCRDECFGCAHPRHEVWVSGFESCRGTRIYPAQKALRSPLEWGHDLHDDLHSQELDLVLDNECHPDGLDQLAPCIFVEAKNWGTRVGSAEVACLDWKVRLAGESYGILVAAKGVTGRPEDFTSAWRILREAKREGRHLFVMTPKECWDARPQRTSVNSSRGSECN